LSPGDGEMIEVRRHIPRVDVHVEQRSAIELAVRDRSAASHDLGKRLLATKESAYQPLILLAGWHH
jgi:hypothetical protein